MEKIIVNKNDTAADILEKVLRSADADIIVVIPKNAEIGNSAVNFAFLKRESAAAHKVLHIESVDESVLALALQSRLEAAHPLFSAGRGAKSLSDIVPRDVAAHETPHHGRKRAPVPEPQEVRQAPSEEIPELAHKKHGKKFTLPTMGRYWKIIFGLVALGILFWGGTALLARATVTIHFKKTPWSFSNTIIGSDTATAFSAGSATIPAQFFALPKDTTQFFPATGHASVSTKAKGTLTIYNNYSAKPQQLVATTRFVTSDGKLFRLDSGVTVPGAQMVAGKLQASSITTSVTADKAGDVYNVGPVAKLSIPGFQGTPKYAGFYGALLNGASGGAVGDHPVPTAADIASAKGKMNGILSAAFTNTFLGTIPQGFKIIDGATTFQVTKLVVRPETDSQGNFSVFGEAQYQALGFRESDLRGLLSALASQGNPNHMIENLENLPITYLNVKPNFTNHTIQFSITTQGNLTPTFDADAFKASVLGLNRAEAEAKILSLPELADATVSFWPRWVGSIPKNPAKVTIDAH